MKKDKKWRLYNHSPLITQITSGQQFTQQQHANVYLSAQPFDMIEKDAMQDNNIEISSEKMNNPSYKLLVTTPMAAIMSSGKANSEWSDLLKSIGPIYTEAADNTHGEVKEALLTVSFILKGGDTFIRQFFENDTLNLDGMMEISATGADVWMCKLADKEIEDSDVVKLFKAIQAGLIETTGELREENDMIDQLIQIQDKVIEHISTLN